MSENVSFDKHDFQTGFTEHATFKANNEDKVKPTGDLLKWVNYQNLCHKTNKSGGTSDLTAEKTTMLDNINFTWKLSQDERWDKKFDEVAAFK